MRIISLCTWSKSVSAALFDDGQLICENHLDGNRGGDVSGRSSSAPSTSAGLTPLIRDLMHRAGWSFPQLEAVVVAIGPGSFTGLRTGVVTAKTIAYSVGIPIVGVNTLAAIACLTADQLQHQARESSGLLVKSVINAQRRQLFGASFAVTEPWVCEERSPLRVWDIPEWVQNLQAGDVVAGSGLTLLGNDIALPAETKVAPQSSWHPNAVDVGKVGIQRLSRGDRDDVWKIEPLYYRASAAEEKLSQNRG